jgi:group I intron endonuclease
MINNINNKIELSLIYPFTKVDHILNNSKLIYYKPKTNQTIIMTELKKKIGVYVWINTINKKVYIGSSVNLRSRIYTYFSPVSLSKTPNAPLTRAFTKYTHDDFIFGILEYGEDPKDILNLEQKYLDLYLPEYNILKIAGSPLGQKRSLIVRERQRLAAKNRIISEEVQKALSEFRSSRRGELNSFFGKKHTNETKAIMRDRVLSRVKYLGPKVFVTVIDTLNNNQTTYDTIRKAAEALGVNSSTLAARKMRKSNNLFQNKYKIIFNNLP